MKKSFKIGLVLLSMVFAVAYLYAAEKATKEECVAKCKEAAELVKKVGVDAAIKKIMEKNSPFVWKDTYIVLFNIDTGVTLAHPANPVMIGKSNVGLKDINGKMFYNEFLVVAKNQGEGWVNYMWPKPGETTPSPKASYIYRVPGENVAAMAGIYE